MSGAEWARGCETSPGADHLRSGRMKTAMPAISILEVRPGPDHSGSISGSAADPSGAPSGRFRGGRGGVLRTDLVAPMNAGAGAFPPGALPAVVVVPVRR